ncbi:MAG: ATP-dependent Clp protease ATP-binding subunit [Bacteroidetes bacterium]|jgi:ATP-dependent Clp protease ATP-binding subunit ClpB|nr:ATP-dependent Clp protease ATP-binding subunit [Bacteroidota bacterium]MBK6820604.1 ATP-dependent Clp protease ATP-binding subunit [Bacteroidota bacterium]MBK8329619.1 ATP-dependent Clp protease ATP-binding subunit [Bacteroidota bacterium]MBK9299149.1 ATP-dependent Clp protease ATP-binding subunit [Bacteroidota bacterium]
MNPSNLNAMTDEIKQVVHIAQRLAKENMHSTYSPAHLLKAILHKDFPLLKKLESLGIDVYYIEEWAEIRIETYPRSSGMSDNPQPDKDAKAVFEEADNIRLKINRDVVDLDSLIISCVTPGVGFNYEQLKTLPITPFILLEKLQSNIPIQTSDSQEKGNASGNTSLDALHKYCYHKTEQAREGKLQNIIGRDKEIRQMSEILSRKTKSNVILMGEPGVGKSALLDGFALAVVNNKVPLNLRSAEIYEIDNSALIAGAQYKGEIEDRLRKIIKEITSLENGILFIDELHTLIDKHNANAGAVSVLKPELSKGLLTMVGTTTVEEYRKSIEKDEAFNRRFETILVDEPNVEIAEKMVNGLLDSYIKHHQLEVDEKVIPEAIRLAKRFIKERRLPDAAIDLLDRTMAVTKMMVDTGKNDVADLQTRFSTLKENANDDELNWFYLEIQNTLSPVLLSRINEETEFKKLQSNEQRKQQIETILTDLHASASEDKVSVELADLVAVVANKTGIPIGKVQTKEKERLINMEVQLAERVIGQDHALKTVSDAILESRSGLNKSGQPIASFFFLGPTGTGKTELAKSLAEFLFQDENSIIRFDMSEFKEEHSAALLYGAPPGYVGYEEGGMLVNKIRQQPYAIVLFDEIEKAHPSVFDIFLQVLDEGKMHDRLGKEGDFSNAVILFTSNIGAEQIIESFGKGEIPKSDDLLEKMANFFRPEFLARITEIIPFAPISDKNVVKIFNIHSAHLYKLLEQQGITLTITDKAKDVIAMMGFTPKYGARPLKGIIRTKLRKPLSRMIINGEIGKGSKVHVDVNELQELVWEKS